MAESAQKLISIIIPAFNEENFIEETLRSIPAFSSEIIVADGASTDKTRIISKKYAKVIIVEGTRAHRMNAGARISKGDILVFLHPDTILPKGAIKEIRNILENHDAGAFYLEFGHKSLIMNLTGCLSNLRMAWLKMIWGDQTLFIRREVFEQLGGFKNMELFEDAEFSKRLRKIARLGFIKKRVITSARRYLRKGILKQNLINQFLKILYALGVSDRKLKQLYERL